MRFAFGLGGLLIAIGVLVFIMRSELTYDKAAIDAGKKATDQASQLAGRDAESGAPARESATLEPQSSANKIDSVLVTSVAANGAYAKFWGLQRGDSIVEIGPLLVKDLINSSSDADAYVQDAYQRHEPLTVMRDGTKMTLGPKDGDSGGNPIQDQLNAIGGGRVPTH